MGRRLMELKQDNAPAPAAPDAFAVLEGEAARLEGEAIAAATPPAPPDTTEEEIADASGELLAALQLARMMVAPMFRWWKEFGSTWDDKTLDAIAAGGAAVMQKHGWTFGGVMSEFGPYIALGAATIPPALVTYQAIQERKAAPDERPQQAKD